MRILLVEDEPDTARMLAKGLREQTYAVDVAADGDVALYQMAINEYDLVLLDVMLPWERWRCRVPRDSARAVRRCRC